MAVGFAVNFEDSKNGNLVWNFNQGLKGFKAANSLKGETITFVRLSLDQIFLSHSELMNSTGE